MDASFFSNDASNASSFSADNLDAAIKKLKSLTGPIKKPQLPDPFIIVPPWLYAKVKRIKEENPSYNEYKCLEIALSDDEKK